MADPTIDDLDPAVLAQLEAFLATFTQEQYPNMDLQPGRVLREILIRPESILHALARLEISRFKQSTSMLAISANPALSDPALVDAVLSNYRLTRDPGAAAQGQVTVVVDTLIPTLIPYNTVITFDSLQFKTNKAFVGVTTAEAANIDPTTQRQMFPVAGTNPVQYAFVVDVQAVSPGALYKIRRNSTVSSITPAPVGFVSAYATADFTLGQNPQTNADLVALFHLALTPKVLSGRKHIDSTVRSVAPTTKAVSVIGAGDPEMLRDKHNIFKMSNLGKVDIYARTDSYPATVLIKKSASLVNADTKLWQIALGRNDFPGFYRIEAILPTGVPGSQGTLEITEETRYLDLTQVASEFVPDIQNMTEGGYSSYQTAILQFLDPDSDTAVLAPTYDLYVQGFLSIGHIQSFVNDRSVHNPNGDYLVRAPVPAYLTMSIRVEYTDDANIPDAGAIKQAIVDAVNGINFTLGQLPLSLIHKAIHGIIPNSALVRTPIDLRCQVLRPDGSVLNLQSPQGIHLPNDPVHGVTSRTTVFLLSLDDIDLTIEKVSVLPV